MEKGNEFDYGTVKIYVPKNIIIEFLEHPEEYGDDIVVLKNGMWTDVFKDDDGQLYTLTNDDALIKYLSSIESK